MKGKSRLTTLLDSSEGRTLRLQLKKETILLKYDAVRVTLQLIFFKLSISATYYHLRENFK